MITKVDRAFPVSWEETDRVESNAMRKHGLNTGKSCVFDANESYQETLLGCRMTYGKKGLEANTDNESVALSALTL